MFASTYQSILKTGALPSIVRRFGNHLDQDARNAGWSDPSSTENSTGIISFVVTLPFRSFSTTTSCWAPSGPTGIAVADADFDVGVAQLFQPPYCPLRELIDDFDAVNPAGQFGEHCGLIAEAGTDFENHVVRLELKQVSHHRNHKRLRDRLIETNRNWPVQVSVRLDLDRHKLVSRHLGHRSEDSLVQRHLANLGGHVFGYGPDCHNHLSSLFLKKFRVHEPS